MKSGVDLTVRRRIWIVLLFFLVGFIALLVRLFTLQVIYHKEYKALVAHQQGLVKNISVERGSIYAREKDGTLVPLALNKTEETLVVSPRLIENPEEAARIISEALKIDPDVILNKLADKTDPYEVVASRLEVKEAEKLSLLLPKGFYFEEEKRRFYPHNNIASHLLGFVSKEKEREEGRYGLERFYEGELSGKSITFNEIKSANGFWMAFGRKIINPPRKGSALYLTIDYNIQLKAEEILSQAFDKWKAIQGSVLVLDPKTGKILAMATRPNFNPNEFSKEKDYSRFQNPLVEFMYELGSVMKPLTLAAAVEGGLIDAETTYDDPGEWRIGGYTIKNFDGKAYKTQTMTQVLEKSLNTGAVYVARLLGKSRQLEYFKKFGLGEITRIDLPNESKGNVLNLKAGRDIDYATASFGQGIAVTPIQMAMAIGVIANGGKLMRPYVVEKIVDEGGMEIKTEPEVVRQVISKETAEELTKMLVSAVRNGFENRAGVKGYFVAGKTGTAQIPRKDGRGYSDKVIHTFIGYAPAFDPKFLIYLQLNEPRGNRFAANTLTPAFHDLAEYILNYYEVPPDEK